MTYRVVESVPPRRLVTPHRGSEPSLRRTLDVRAHTGRTGTRLTITESGEVYNPVFRFVVALFPRHTSTMEGVLRALGTKHGETVAPEVAGSRDLTR